MKSSSHTGSLAHRLTRLLALAFAFVLLPFAFVAAAATVTGTFLRSDGTPFVGDIVFRPSAQARLASGSVLTSDTVTVATDTNGVVSTTLLPGNYGILVGGTQRFTIGVIDTNASLSIPSITLSGAITNISATPLPSVYVDSVGVIAYPTNFWVANVAGISNALAPSFAAKLAATNGVAVGLTTPTVPTTGNSVVNKTALDAAIAASSGASKLDATNGVAVALTGSLTNITVDGAYVLRIAAFTPAINEVTVPVAYQYFQRTNTSAGLITINANVAGPTGTAVEAKFGGGAWTSIGSSGTDGNLTGYLAASVGQGALQVRLTGTTNATSIASVSVGDIFMLWGQSNASGRSTSNQSFTNTTTLAGLYGNDQVWRTLVDPVDSATNQVDSISSDYDAGGMGSVWPLVADEIIASTGVPVAFVPCAKGSTGFGLSQPTWNPASDRYDTSTLFGSAMSRLRAIGGKVKAILWWQGEGGFDDTSGASYNTPFSTMAAVVAAEFPSTKIIPAKIQDCTGITDSRQTNGWYAIGLLWSTNANVLRGPTLADAPVGGAGNIFSESEGSSPFYHIKTSTTTKVAAHRWATNLIAHFP